MEDAASLSVGIACRSGGEFEACVVGVTAKGTIALTGGGSTRISLTLVEVGPVNAFLLMSAGWMTGADAAPAAAAPIAAAPVAAAQGCGSGCGYAAPSCGTCNSGCDSGCGHKASWFDKIRARFARSSSCGCDHGCNAAPSCCTPACGTPLYSGHSCHQKHECCAPTYAAPTCYAAAPACHDSCNSCSSGCGKASYFDKWRAKWASWRHKGSCCGTSCDSGCGGCGSAAPAGCSLPPVAAPIPVPQDAPKVMPKPIEMKKTIGMNGATIITPASSDAAPAFVVPAIQAAPMPAPMPSSAKSPF